MTTPTSDAEVPEFWDGLGLPGLADIHVHFLPPRMLRHVWATSAEHASAGGGSGVAGQATASNAPIIYKWSDEERVDHLRALGVRAFTALAFANKAGMAADLNAWTLDFATRTPGCIPSATFYPEQGVNRYTRFAIESGARIFKIHLQLGQFGPTHARLDAVWGVLADAGIPVIAHAATGDPGNVHTGPEPFAAVLRRHPNLTAIIAHLGSPDYVDFLELSEKYERVCLDTSMAFTAFLETTAPFPRAHVPRLRELGLRGKVLLGSCFPNLPHPYAEQLSALAALDLGDDWLRAVCWHNANRLLGLDSSPADPPLSIVEPGET